MPEEEQIHADNKRYQYHGKDTRVDSPCHFDHRFQSQCVSRQRKHSVRARKEPEFLDPSVFFAWAWGNLHLMCVTRSGRAKLDSLLGDTA
jgi:hypothetical protein